MTNNHPISNKILNAFGIQDRPVLLTGGQGETYKAGDVVLKPVDNQEEYEWIAETINNLSTANFRVPRYIKSLNGSWIEDGWIAYEFIEGEHLKDNWDKKIEACELFHKSLETLPCQEFIKKKNHPWAIADRVAWGEQKISHHPRLQKQLDKLKALIEPVDLPSQMIHGDFTGNVLFHKKLPPAIIDFSPYYRPKDFAKAIIVVDAFVWESADASVFDLVKDLPQIKQLIIRAEMRRLIEIEECMKYFNKGTLDDIEAHKPIVDLILKGKL